MGEGKGGKWRRGKGRIGGGGDEELVEREGGIGAGGGGELVEREGENWWREGDNWWRRKGDWVGATV